MIKNKTYKFEIMCDCCYGCKKCGRQPPDLTGYNILMENNNSVEHKTYKLEFSVDPPMNCPEFGEWSGDPNIALKDKHGLVTITVDAEASILAKRVL